MRIGDLAKATDTKVETIRWYEKEGLLPEPARTSGNYRSYGTKHLDRLSFIRRARNLGFSLDDVRELMALAGDSEHPCEAVDVIAGSHLVEVKRKMASPQGLCARQRFGGHHENIGYATSLRRAMGSLRARNSPGESGFARCQR